MYNTCIKPWYNTHCCIIKLSTSHHHHPFGCLSGTSAVSSIGMLRGMIWGSENIRSSQSNGSHKALNPRSVVGAWYSLIPLIRTTVHHTCIILVLYVYVSKHGVWSPALARMLECRKYINSRVPCKAVTVTLIRSRNASRPSPLFRELRVLHKGLLEDTIHIPSVCREERRLATVWWLDWFETVTQATLGCLFLMVRVGTVSGRKKWE